MPFSLVPQERQFFVLFREDAANLLAAMRCLNDMLNGNPADFEARAKSLKDLEHQGDEITHRVVQELNGTFITPFDRDDIYNLSAALDDVLDLVEETADTIVIDRVESITSEAKQMAAILLEMGQELSQAIDRLDVRKEMKEHWLRLHDLENQGDAIVREAIGALFQDGHDAVTIIKWKDVYALLEKTIDRTEDIANILESVTIRNA